MELANYEERKSRLAWLDRFPVLKEFLARIFGEADLAQFVDIDDLFDNGLQIKFYTSTHTYIIRILPSNFVFCGSEARIAKCGEDWLRGNDIADGYVDNPDTWTHILEGIVFNEVVKIDRPEYPKLIAKTDGDENACAEKRND
jgi:hypothetical protein